MAPATEDEGRFLSRLPPDVAASFSADQLDAMRLAFGMRHAEHALDVRRILHLPWGRYYFVLLGGRHWRLESGRRLAPTLCDTLAVGTMLVAGITIVALGVRALL